MINPLVRRIVLGGLTMGSLSGIILGTLGCSGTDATGVPPVVTTDPYTTLRLNVRAAVMSTIVPYDTLQLSATAYDANGVPIPLPGPVVYTASDTLLSVSATGLVTVKHKTGTNSYVIAKVQDTTLKLTRADTAYILGTTTAPTTSLASFSIQPVGSDSAVLDLNGGTKTVTVTALDTQGHVILNTTTSLVTHFTSSNPTVASVNAKTGVVTALSPGKSVLTATVTYYGVTKTDSLVFRIGYADVNQLTLSPVQGVNGVYTYNWNVSNLVVGVNKTVLFLPQLLFVGEPNQLTFGLLTVGTTSPGDSIARREISAVFDDSTAVDSSRLSGSLLAKNYASNGTGNVSVQIPDSFVVVDSVWQGSAAPVYLSGKLTHYCETGSFPCVMARSFSTPGTYHYHSATTGASGTITVVAP